MTDRIDEIRARNGLDREHNFGDGDGAKDDIAWLLAQLERLAQEARDNDAALSGQVGCLRVEREALLAEVERLRAIECAAMEWYRDRENSVFAKVVVLGGKPCECDGDDRYTWDLACPRHGSYRAEADRG
jgi:hypothetical protein